MSQIIRELLPKNRMRNVDRVYNWEEAIKVASESLLEDGIIEEKYIQAMINSVHENGPYIVLKDFFALPHAKAGEGVNKQGMSLLTLDEEVDLKGNPVKVFMILAAVDSNSHLEALSDLSSLLMDDEIYEVFISGNLEKINEILEREEV